MDTNNTTVKCESVSHSHIGGGGSSKHETERRRYSAHGDDGIERGSDSQTDTVGVLRMVTIRLSGQGRHRSMILIMHLTEVEVAYASQLTVP